MFVSRGLPTCKMLIKKSVFMRSTKRSCNTILQNIVGTDHLYTSPLTIVPALEAYAIMYMHTSLFRFFYRITV